MPGVDGSEDLAQVYNTQNQDVDEAVDRLINWQVAKAGTAGFLTGVGGMLTLPVAIPANLVGVLYIQIRMIGAIAHLRGYDVRNDRGNPGGRLSRRFRRVRYPEGHRDQHRHPADKQMIVRISGEVLKKINHAVGFQLVT